MLSDTIFLFQILLAVDLALDCTDTQADLWSRICRDEYMAYAVQECYRSIEKILYSLVDNEGRLWYEFYCSSYFIWFCFTFVRQIKGTYSLNPSTKVRSAKSNIDWTFYIYWELLDDKKISYYNLTL